ncbi:hypothetical protein F383_03243 [Gossypium arboreum]|uniref:Uncharacterized protein n=1 Tax=Gossypium arboreum TaxID=29729 RepID=A0A0B0NAL0_GOSAR|nr:hypothetical protein F383_13825 [Gossypium arboreum]KHG21735.1 hypothetical protein F383_03243 [Gossypium arboreum]
MSSATLRVLAMTIFSYFIVTTP